MEILSQNCKALVQQLLLSFSFESHLFTFLGKLDPEEQNSLIRRPKGGNNIHILLRRHQRKKQIAGPQCF